MTSEQVLLTRDVVRFASDGNSVKSVEIIQAELTLPDGRELFESETERPFVLRGAWVVVRKGVQ